MNKCLLYIAVENAFTPGGLGVHTRGIIEGIVANNIYDAVYVLMPTTEQDFFLDSDLNNKGVKLLKSTAIDTHRYQRSFMYRCLKRAQLLCSALRQAKRLVKSSQFTVYMRYKPWCTPILVWWLHKQAQLLIEYNNYTQKELDYECQNHLTGLRKVIKSHALYRNFLSRLEHYTARHAKANLCVNEQIVHHFRNLGCQRSITMLNATSHVLIDYTETLTKSQARQKLGLAQHHLIISHVGTMKGRDHLHQLLNAVWYCYYKPWVTILIATNDLKQYQFLTSLSQQLGIEEQMIWFSPRDRYQCIDIVLASDVVPLLKPDMGYALSCIKYYEALGCGRPVLVTDVPYINEVAVLGYGQVVPSHRHTQAIAKAIDGFYEHHRAYEAMEQPMREYARQNHTWYKRVADTWREIGL